MVVPEFLHRLGGDPAGAESVVFSPAGLLLDVPSLGGIPIPGGPGLGREWLRQGPERDGSRWVAGEMAGDGQARGPEDRQLQERAAHSFLSPSFDDRLSGSMDCSFLISDKAPPCAQPSLHLRTPGTPAHSRGPALLCSRLCGTRPHRVHPLQWPGTLPSAPLAGWRPLAGGPLHAAGW